jgi:hypothetical protein
VLLSNLEWTQEHLPVSQLVHDIRVNPRDPSDAWVRKQLESYNPALLGVFIVSERILENGEKQLAILDGANRARLMRMAGFPDELVQCNVFHGLTIEQEAAIALEYNDRRQWTGIRKFQADCTTGDPIALQILRIITEAGWRIDAATAPGVMRGVTPFYRIITTAGSMAAGQARATRGTERWRAALESGKQDAFRVMEEATSVYTAAFPQKPSGYAGTIIYGIALVLLKFGTRVNLERLTTQLRNVSRGSQYVLSDARGIATTMKLPLPDAIAFLMIRFYNQGMQTNSKARLDEAWRKTSR